VGVGLGDGELLALGLLEPLGELLEHGGRVAMVSVMVVVAGL
jgi:hypothetical protein